MSNRVIDFISGKRLKRFLDDYHSMKEDMKSLSSAVNDLSNISRQQGATLDRLTSEMSKMKYIDEYQSVEYNSLLSRNTKGKIRVLIAGFYGAQNVGDELMLESVLNSIKDEKKLDITVLLSNNYDVDSNYYAPYRVIHYPQKSTDYSRISESFDLVIWGGGALLDDDEYYYRGKWSTISYILMSITKGVLKRGGKSIILGVSTNKDLYDNNFLSDLQFVINNSAYFSLRDTNSLDTLKRAGLDTKKVNIIDDISLTRHLPLKHGRRKNKLTVGAVLIYSNDNMPTITAFFDEFIDYLAAKYPSLNTEIHLIPFYTYQENDRVFIDGLLNGMKKKKNISFIVDTPPISFDAFERTFSSLDAVLSMRYHSTLLSCVNGLNTISIDYSNNHKHYHNKISYISDYYCSDLFKVNFNDLSSKAAEICKEIMKDNPKKLRHTPTITNKELQNIITNTIRSPKKA